MLLSFTMLTKRQKTTAIKSVRKHDEDTGSAAVQTAILHKKIDELAKHLKKNPKDTHSRKGLLGMVSKRMSTLKYLKKSDPETYAEVIKALDLKK